MLTFTHTYLILLAHRKTSSHSATIPDAELILGNVVPDFVTHLGRDKFQAIAHNLSLFAELKNKRKLDWGALFHILCDNYTTLKRLTFNGNYHQYPRNGFIESLSKDFDTSYLKKIPKRRILQCAFDVLVIREERDVLVEMLTSAELFLRSHFDEILHHVASVYEMEKDHLRVGIQRFSHVYGPDFIQKSSRSTYRLFPLIRSMLNLSSLTDPDIIFKEIDAHPELMNLVEQHLKLIQSNWHELLEETVTEVLAFPDFPAGIFD